MLAGGGLGHEGCGPAARRRAARCDAYARRRLQRLRLVLPQRDFGVPHERREAEVSDIYYRYTHVFVLQSTCADESRACGIYLIICPTVLYDRPLSDTSFNWGTGGGGVVNS
jgi:hypothetical protein